MYYEIGYAKALDKKLILTSKKGTSVHFDLHGYNRVEWTGSENLKKQLKPIVDEFARSFGLYPIRSECLSTQRLRATLSDRDRPANCPLCQSPRVADIVYGFVDMGAMAPEPDSGSSVLGGCSIEEIIVPMALQCLRARVGRLYAGIRRSPTQ